MSDLDAYLSAFIARYPVSEPQDLMKLLYQREFGCGHMVSDEARCLKMLEAEYQTAARGETLLEDIGGGYSRLYLGSARDAGYAPGLLSRVFFLSAQKKSGDGARFLALADALKNHFDPGAVDALKQEAAASGFAPFSHSETYRAAYRPAYRVILTAYGALLPALRLIDERKKEKRPLLVGLDGRCGAGKTTAAGLLSDFFGAPVLHMDDFFLPPALRTKARLAEPGGNIHCERFLAEVAEPLERGDPAVYGVFDCSVGRVTRQNTLPITDVIVIEGSYALHPRLQSLYDVRLFADAKKETQKARILARNGAEGYLPFRDKWIPMEEAYFDFFRIRDVCDEILML